jgi:8-oxo-dGTP diphosphatase
MNKEVNLKHCPKCGKLNLCQILEHKDSKECWCMKIHLPSDVESRIKKTYPKNQCLCQECLNEEIMHGHQLTQKTKRIEYFDARNRQGDCLGIDLIRGEIIPKGHYHIVVEIYAINRENQILVTQRDSNKPFGLKWEITGGSLLKGEKIIDGAIRELYEETGLIAKPNQLTLAYVHKKHPVIYYAYVLKKDFNAHFITLEPGETVDFKLLDKEAFMSLVSSDDYAKPLVKRWMKYQKKVIKHWY